MDSSCESRVAESSGLVSGGDTTGRAIARFVLEGINLVIDWVNPGCEVDAMI
jgi:hypothetical protein